MLKHSASLFLALDSRKQLVLVSSSHPSQHSLGGQARQFVKGLFCDIAISLEVAPRDSLQLLWTPASPNRAQINPPSASTLIAAAHHVQIFTPPRHHTHQKHRSQHNTTSARLHVHFINQTFFHNNKSGATMDDDSSYVEMIDRYPGPDPAALYLAPVLVSNPPPVRPFASTQAPATPYVLHTACLHQSFAGQSVS